jgi:hypothetical protein
MIPYTILKHEPKARITDRTAEYDPRRPRGPQFAVVVDKGFQAPFILGEGDTEVEAVADALAGWNPTEPHTPSYEELDTLLQTREHIDLIRLFLREFAVELLKRGETHDRSKLVPPEVDTFTKYTARLKGMTYGSEEYTQCLKDMAPALKHHYAHNRHHPEFYPQGIEGMTLVDLLEMFIDWKASVRRHADGDLSKSIDHNEKRFNMSPQLVAIFRNTLKEFG